jgi:choline dehydrogenase
MHCKYSTLYNLSEGILTRFYSIYHRCAASDYDEWALQGWAWKDLEPYFRKAERFTPSSSWPISTEALHGKRGPWRIRYPSFISPLFAAFVAGCNSIGVPTVPDINHGQSGMVGVTRLQTLVDNEGRRSSAATAYLTDDVCRRKNLKISVGMTATHIITQTTSSGSRIVEGVEFSSGIDSLVRYRVKARKDVIVACGAVHTPHLLKLSGIGPKDELTRHGIKVVKDLPGVGANLQVNSTRLLDNQTRQTHC